MSRMEKIKFYSMVLIFLAGAVMLTLTVFYGVGHRWGIVGWMLSVQWSARWLMAESKRQYARLRADDLLARKEAGR